MLAPLFGTLFIVTMLHWFEERIPIRTDVPRTVGPMTASPDPQQKPTHTPLARWAVGLASAAAVLVALGVSGLGGGGAGAALSLAAFVAAVVARARHERWVLLWLPLVLLPVLVISSPLWV